MVGCTHVASWPTALNVAFYDSQNNYTEVQSLKSTTLPTELLIIDVFHGDGGTYPPTETYTGATKLATCNICTQLIGGCGATNCTGPTFLALGGSAAVTRADSNPDAGKFIGSGSNLHFVQYDFNNDAVVDGGGCYDVDAVTLNVSWGGAGGAGGGAGGGTGGAGGSGGAGNLSFWVVRVGDGDAGLSAAAAPVTLEQHQINTGALISTLTLPTGYVGTGVPFTLAGSASTEGELSLSTNGSYLLLAGYVADAGTASVGSSSSSTIPRAVCRVDAQGNFDTSTRFNAFSGGAMRGVASSDGVSMWVSGSSSGTTGGVQSVQFGGTTPTRLITAPDNARAVGIFGGNLYISSASAPYLGIAQVGTGLPTTAGQTATPLPGFPDAGNNSSIGFVGFDTDTVAGIDVIYVADSRSIATGGGLQKWTLGSGSWTYAATFDGGLSAGLVGLTGYRAGGTNTLIATTFDAPARVVRFDDIGLGQPTAVPLCTSAAGTAYRGVALPPQ
jgi:hypothetical protein